MVRGVLSLYTVNFVSGTVTLSGLLGVTVLILIVTIAARFRGVCLLLGCLTSKQHASVSQGPICTDNFMCCHIEIEAADQTFYFTQLQYTDTAPTSPSTDPITPDAWQGSHWSANVLVTGMTRPGKIPSQAGFEPRIFRSRGGCLNN